HAACAAGTPAAGIPNAASTMAARNARTTTPDITFSWQSRFLSAAHVESLELHAGRLDDLLAALHLLAHVGGGRLRRAARRLGGEIRKTLSDLRAFERL